MARKKYTGPVEHLKERYADVVEVEGDASTVRAKFEIKNGDMPAVEEAANGYYGYPAADFS